MCGRFPVLGDGDWPGSLAHAAGVEHPVEVIDLVRGKEEPWRRLSAREPV
jgi:hypothetical protein